ncbi:hypothetical protein F5B17DRAFT_164827 [Nemania serpens]|nr:hypothetical protein F5B17DRAFT_164827 [Nemania serpens]
MVQRKASRTILLMCFVSINLLWCRSTVVSPFCGLSGEAITSLHIKISLKPLPFSLGSQIHLWSGSCRDPDNRLTDQAGHYITGGNAWVPVEYVICRDATS